MTIEPNWLNDTLCSFAEKSRIELGPQMIELDCTKENLSNEVTFAHYQAGKVDALGKTIEPSAAGDGNNMIVVDWRCKHAPKVWKVYKHDGERFVFVEHFDQSPAGLASALTLAQELAGGN